MTAKLSMNYKLAPSTKERLGALMKSRGLTADALFNELMKGSSGERERAYEQARADHVREIALLQHLLIARRIFDGTPSSHDGMDQGEWEAAAVAFIGAFTAAARAVLEMGGLEVSIEDDQPMALFRDVDGDAVPPTVIYSLAEQMFRNVVEQGLIEGRP